MLDGSTEGLFSFAVVESAGLVELGFAAVPLDDELFLEELLIADNELHEGRGKPELLRVLPDKEEDDGLQAVLDADLAILSDQFQEGFLVLFPVLHDVSLGTEQPTSEYPVAIFG